MAQNWWDKHPVVGQPPQQQSQLRQIVPPRPETPAPVRPVQQEMDEERLYRLRNPQPAPQTPEQREAARLDVILKRRELAKPQPVDPAVQAAQQEQAELDGMAKLLFKSRRQFDQNLKGGMPGPIAGWLPTDENTAFDATASGLTEAATTAFRQKGVGSQDQMEFAAKMRAYQPKSTSTDAANESRFETILTRLNAKRAGLGLPPLSWDDEAEVLGGGGFTDEHKKQIIDYIPKAKSPEDLMEFARNISRSESGATVVGNANDLPAWQQYLQSGGDPSKIEFSPAPVPPNAQAPSGDFEILGFEDE